MYPNLLKIVQFNHFIIKKKGKKIHVAELVFVSIVFEKTSGKQTKNTKCEKTQKNMADTGFASHIVFLFVWLWKICLSWNLKLISDWLDLILFLFQHKKQFFEILIFDWKFVISVLFGMKNSENEKHREKVAEWVKIWTTYVNTFFLKRMNSVKKIFDRFVLKILMDFVNKKFDGFMNKSLVTSW